MDEKTALKREMESHRTSIGHTIDQLENRVHPGRVTSRATYRMKRRVARWKDEIMGTDEGQLKEKMGDMADTVGDAPQEVMTRTKGNPWAAGLIAVGAGALIGGLLPKTRQEERMVRDIQPDLNRAASELGDAGKHVAEDVKEQAREGMENVRDSAKSSGEEMAEEAKRTF